MIDLHSHILPNLDDGSKSVEESLEMLRLLKKQGITKVVATPHFYANHNTVETFLEKRDYSYKLLKKNLTENLPEVILGAEVKYYEGISRLENIEKLAIGGSKLILLEMPMRTWTEFILRELNELSCSGKHIIVLAHIERYLRFQKKGLLEELVRNRIFIQANADFFISYTTRRKAMTLLSENLIHFIGSDCHNLQSRPPKMDLALSYIKRKAGDNFISEMNELAKRFI